MMGFVELKKVYFFMPIVWMGVVIGEEGVRGAGGIECGEASA